MGTRRTEKACATRRQLLDAALEVIGEKGYSAATVDEIVEVAGVSKGVAYYHFKSKAAMAESILEDGIGRIVAGFECIAAEAPTAADALTGMIELFASGIFENKAFGRFFVSELWREGRVWSDAMRGYERRLLDVLEGQIARGQREGCIRPEIDPAFEAVALVGMVLTGALYHLGDEGPLTAPERQGRRGRKAALCAGARRERRGPTPTACAGAWQAARRRSSRASWTSCAMPTLVRGRSGRGVGEAGFASECERSGGGRVALRGRGGGVLWNLGAELRGRARGCFASLRPFHRALGCPTVPGASAAGRVCRVVSNSVWRRAGDPC